MGFGDRIRRARVAVPFRTLMALAALPGAGCAGLGNPLLVWEDLPRIRSGVKAWSHTSKNPFNMTLMDWTQYTARDGGDRELAHYQGTAGMLVHAWFDPFKSVGRLKLYLDGSDKPAFDRSFADYFSAPASATPMWHEKDGMLWAYPCLPFDSRFKASFTDSAQWYQFTLQTYREARFSEALSAKQATFIKAKLEMPVGTFPGSDSGNQSGSGSVSVPVGGTRTIFSRDSAGVVRSFRLAPVPAAPGALDQVFIRIITDSEVTAEVPMPFFFGGFPGAEPGFSRGLPAGRQGSAFYSYFPMPFWDSFRLEIVNRGPAAITLPFRIGWSDRNPYPRDSTGVFRVQYNGGIRRYAGEAPFVQLETHGSGHMVGCISGLTGSIEGNFSVFTDGSRTPAIETTGGEDFFNHSYGIHPGVSGPLEGGLAQDVGYRFFLLDYIPFTRSLVFTQDHGHVFQGDRDGTFRSAVFYYHRSGASLIASDSMDVGESGSEASHGFRIKESRGRLQEDTSAYEGYYSAPFRDKGRWTDGEISFRAAIPAGNDGARLRRRINQTAYHQALRVLVDGIDAGIWFEQGSNYVLNYPHAEYRLELESHFRNLGQAVPTWANGRLPLFRDSEFEIPADLTRGKTSLEITLKAVGSLAVVKADAGLVNAYQYWIYAYAGPAEPVSIAARQGGIPPEFRAARGRTDRDLRGRKHRSVTYPIFQGGK